MIYKIIGLILIVSGILITALGSPISKQFVAKFPSAGNTESLQRWILRFGFGLLIVGAAFIMVDRPIYSF